MTKFFGFSVFSMPESYWQAAKQFVLGTLAWDTLLFWIHYGLHKIPWAYKVGSRKRSVALPARPLTSRDCSFRQSVVLKTAHPQETVSMEPRIRIILLSSNTSTALQPRSQNRQHDHRRARLFDRPCAHGLCSDSLWLHRRRHELPRAVCLQRMVHAHRYSRSLRVCAAGSFSSTIRTSSKRTNPFHRSGTRWPGFRISRTVSHSLSVSRI